MDSDKEINVPDNIPRTADEIARRALVVGAIATVAFGDPPVPVIKWLEQEGLTKELTPNERTFLTDPSVEQAQIDFSWKLEALQVLMWSINKLDSLADFDDQCDPEPMRDAIVFPPEPTLEFIASATLRDRDEIAVEYEKVYEAHWKARDARINGKKTPRGIDPGVVYERHYGFNWIIGNEGQPWDEVTCDT